MYISRFSGKKKNKKHQKKNVKKRCYITVTGALDGYGIYLYGRSYSGNADFNADTISSHITVTGGSDAYGIYAYGNSTAEISIKELSGDIDVTAGT